MLMWRRSTGCRQRVIMSPCASNRNIATYGRVLYYIGVETESAESAVRYAVVNFRNMTNHEPQSQVNLN